MVKVVAEKGYSVCFCKR